MMLFVFCCEKVTCSREEMKKFISNALGEVVPKLKQLGTSPYDKNIENKCMKIDECPRGCMAAFVGYEVNNLARSRECEAARFTKCSYVSCRYSCQ